MTDMTDMTNSEFLRFLKEHPELWGVVMDVLKNHHSANKDKE